jgi:hypothetical protein
MNLFLKQWTINVDKIPQKYDKEFAHVWTETVDFCLGKLLAEYDGLREDGTPRIRVESQEQFKKLLKCVRNNEVHVKYSSCYGGVGRRYPDCPKETYRNGQPNPNFGKHYSALISQNRTIKNTLFAYSGWLDFDQRRGHPTILHALGVSNNFALPGFKDYLTEGNFDKICTTLIDYYSADASDPLTKGHIKRLFNRTIYGGKFPSWVSDVTSGVKRVYDGKTFTDVSLALEHESTLQQDAVFALYGFTRGGDSNSVEQGRHGAGELDDPVQNRDSAAWKKFEVLLDEALGRWGGHLI